MSRETINADMRVWDVIQHHPETMEVFRKYGCPDMRKGVYAISAHIMKVRWAARAHDIDLEQLLTGLNDAVALQELESHKTQH